MCTPKMRNRCPQQQNFDHIGEEIPQIALGSLLDAKAVHEMPLEQLFDILQINPSAGLKDMQVSVNRERFGRNLLSLQCRKQPLFLKYLSALCGPLECFLWSAAVVCFFTYAIETASSIVSASENMRLGFVFIAVVLLEAFLRCYQESRMQSIIKSMNKLMPENVTIIRNGTNMIISMEDVVVGDILELRPGDRIPADARIIFTQGNFKVDNSYLTGESEPQTKFETDINSNPTESITESQNMVFFSTVVRSGYARAIVVGVGERTVLGEILKQTTELEEHDMPLTRDMSTFISRLCIIALFFGCISLIASWRCKLSWIDTVMFFIATLLANVPFGVACFIPICLVIATKKMAAKGCFFKHLEAVEALGSTHVICMDKTGTLTENNLKVSHLWFNNKMVVETPELTPDFNVDTANSAAFSAISSVAILCNSVQIPDVCCDNWWNENVSNQNSNPMDIALLRYMDSLGLNCSSFRVNYSKLFEIPFSSQNKFQLSVFQKKPARFDEESSVIALVKGAPETVLEMCSSILVNDREVDFDSDWIRHARNVCESLASLGERVLGFCDLHFINFETLNEDNLEDRIMERLNGGFCFLGLISLHDPPRPSARSAVLQCRKAGIKVIMTTGDHPISARAVARQVGIISADSSTVEELAERFAISIRDVNPVLVNAVVINGTQLKYISDDALKEILKSHDEIVFARLLPSQKLLVTEALQSIGYVVAVTGDGVNDAPALKKANIGITMAHTGTEMAKDASDLILIDDNLNSIPFAVEKGRKIFINLKKCCFFGLADTTPCVLALMVYITMKIPTPFENLPMLIVALIIDALPAVAFAFEKSRKNLMTLKPRDFRKESLVDFGLIVSCYGQIGMIEAMAGFFSYLVVMGYNGFLPQALPNLQSKWNSLACNDLEDSFGQEWTYSQRVVLSHNASTAFFISVVVCQMSNAISLKSSWLSITSWTRNYFLSFAIIMDFALTVLLVYTCGFGTISVAPIKGFCWLLPLPFALLILAWGLFNTQNVF